MAGDRQEMTLQGAVWDAPRVVGGELPLCAEEAAGWLSGEAQGPAAVLRLCQRYSSEASDALWLRYGRSALGVALDLCGVGPQARVAMPSYQCRAVVDKIASRTSAAVPYPLDERLRPDGEPLQAAGRAAQAVITCAYFGSAAISQRLEELGSALRRLPGRPWIIEDRVMCVPDPADARGIGEARCDWTILSFRKHYPVPDGALLLAHSARAREALRHLRCDPASRGELAVAEEAVRLKVLAKVKRHAWVASPTRRDDPDLNGLAESVASEALVDRVADSRAADALPGGVASAAFLGRRDLSRDGAEVGARCRRLMARLEGCSDSAAGLPIRDGQGLGLPLLVRDRAAFLSAAARRGVFLPTHWPAVDAPIACPVARRWHEREVTLPTGAWLSDDDVAYLADVVVTALGGGEHQRSGHGHAH